MSLWEFMAVMAGFAKFNGGVGKPATPDLPDSHWRKIGVEGF